MVAEPRQTNQSSNKMKIKLIPMWNGMRKVCERNLMFSMVVQSEQYKHKICKFIATEPQRQRFPRLHVQVERHLHARTNQPPN